VYYVQRISAADEPAVVADRLLQFLSRLGFRLEGNSILPCGRLVRGNPANSLVAIGPQMWGVTLDVRVEVGAGGGSDLVLAWTAVFAGQFKGKADMAYWRRVFREVRAVASGRVGSVDACREAGLKASWINGVGSTLLVVGAIVAILAAPTIPWKIVATVAVCLTAIPMIHFGPLTE
jgi:hypothetical protein